MDSAEFKISYEGQLYQVDVDTLVTSLLHIAEMVKAVSEKVMPGEELQIKITAPEKGSFSLFLELLRINAKELFGTLFGNTPPAIATAGIITIIVGVLNIKSFLKGKKPDHIQINSGNIIIYLNNVSITAPEHVYDLYKDNRELNNHVERLFDKLTESPEIEGFLLDGNNAGQFRANSAEFPGLAQVNELLVEEELTEVVNDGRLSILKVVFQKDRKWEFIFNGSKISAIIGDEGFWSQIDTGRSFAKGDILVVDLEIIQIYDHDLQCYLNKSYKIIKVKKYEPRLKQGDSLF